MMAGRAVFEDHPNQNRQGRSGQSHLRFTEASGRDLTSPQLSLYGKNAVSDVKA